MSLADVKPSQRCRVLDAADDNAELRSRFYALGLYPGVEVDVLRVAPAGDPMQLRIGRLLLSVRKADAARVRVEVI